MRRTVSRPSGFFRSIAAQGRLRCSASFSGGNSCAPPPGRSTRTTSAPSSASSMQAYGAGPSPLSSTTRMPVRGPVCGCTPGTLATIEDEDSAAAPAHPPRAWHEARVATGLQDILDLEQLEEHVFLGRSRRATATRIFGGEVAGQALVAAGRTVPADRAVHSLHAYFLAPRGR